MRRRNCANCGRGRATYIKQALFLLENSSAVIHFLLVLSSLTFHELSSIDSRSFLTPLISHKQYLHFVIHSTLSFSKNSQLTRRQICLPSFFPSSYFPSSLSFPPSPHLSLHLEPSVPLSSPYQCLSNVLLLPLVTFYPLLVTFTST